MRELEIIDSAVHENGNCEPYVVAIVDDPEENDTKLIIMFGDEAFTAVLSLDRLIEEEDISHRNSWSADRYEMLLRSELYEVDED